MEWTSFFIALGIVGGIFLLTFLMAWLESGSGGSSGSSRGGSSSSSSSYGYDDD